MHDPLRIAGKYTVLEAQHVHSMHAASQLGRLSHLPGALSMEEHRPRAERYPVLAVIFLFSHQSLLRLGSEGFFPYSCSYWVWSSATSAETGFSPRTLRGVLSTKGSLSLSPARLSASAGTGASLDRRALPASGRWHRRALPRPLRTKRRTQPRVAPPTSPPHNHRQRDFAPSTGGEARVTSGIQNTVYYTIMLPTIGHVHREHVGEQTGCQPRQAADDRLTTASGGLDT